MRAPDCEWAGASAERVGNPARVSIQETTPTQAKPRLIQRLERQRARHRRRPTPVRVLYALVGFTFTLGGLAMLILPGPAFVVIPIGLALLSLEFTWAERALDRSLAQATRAREAAGRTSRTVRALTVAAAVLAVAAVAAWAVVGDIPLLPV